MFYIKKSWDKKMGKLHNKKLVFSVLLLITVMAISSTLLMIGDMGNINTLLDIDNIVEPIAMETEKTDANFSNFVKGTKYIFTDSSKIDDFRAGNSKYDITTVEVNPDTSVNPLGSRYNPYVITSVEEWNALATLATSVAATQGKYFALGCDIDADVSVAGVQIKQVPFFAGNFNGNGYKISNVTFSSVTSNTISGNTGVGLFNCVQNATISDMMLDVELTVSGYNVGGLIGVATGSVNIYNCQAVTKITTSSSAGYYGGFIGKLIAPATQNIYRCSADFDYTVTVSSENTKYGGFIGGMYGAININVLDNTTKVVAKTGSSSGRFSGGCIGVLEASNNAKLVVENFVNKLDATTGAVIWDASICHIQANTDCPSSIKFSNIYTVGVDKAGSTTTSRYVITGASGGHISRVKAALTTSNVHTTGTYSKYIYPGFAGADDYTNTSSANYIENIAGAPSGTETGQNNAERELWEKAQADPKLPSNIWADKSAIGQFDPENSPVRNKLVATISFKNLLNGGSEEGVGIPTADYTAGDELPTPTANANHVFLGWTMDKSGESEPFDTLPGGMFGENTLYAVWGVTQDYVDDYITSTLDVKDSIDTIEYDGKKSISLKAEVTHTTNSGGMSNPSVKYHFKQDGNIKESNTTGELSLKVVKDSGQYTYSYRLTDGSEPLWYHDGEVGVNKQMTIEKGHTVTYSDFKTDPATVPYSGRLRKEVEFSLKVFNCGGVEIEQASAAEWESKVGSIASGKNTTNVIIHPKDTDNYNENLIVNGVEFQSETLKLKFDLPEISRILEADVEYSAPYGAGEIIYLFNQVYMQALESGDSIFDDVREMAPYLDGSPITPDNSGAPIFSGSYPSLITEETITVTFKPAQYNVTFNYNDEGNTPNKVEIHKYGDALMRPTDPTFKNLLFVGWYFDSTEKDESGNTVTVNREWRFDSEGDVPRDRVKGNTQLKAMWLEANTLVDISVSVKSWLEARQKIKDGDLTVKATYAGEMDGHTVSRVVTLKWADYSGGISYSTADNMLHVTDGGYPISVSYTFNGETKTVEDLKVDVRPIKVSTAGLTFKDKTVVCEDPDANQKIDSIQGVLPPQIKGVKYVYIDIFGNEVAEADVKGVGEYTVRAEFEMISPDYEAEALSATLSIVNASALAKPTFKGGVTYDGTEKNVEDLLDNFIGDYMEIFGGTAKAKDAGKYFINIRLKNTNGLTWEDGTSAPLMQVEWTIDKSTLVLDWDKWEFVSDGVSGYAPVVSGIADGLGAGDSIDFANDFIYKIYDENGEEVTAATEVGAYRVVAAFNGSVGGNYVLDDVTKEWTFVVVPKSGMTILTIDWGETQFRQDGNVHYPTPTVTDNQGNTLTQAQIAEILTFTDGYNTHSELGTYRVIAKVKNSETHFIRSGGVCVFKIVDKNGNAPSEEETQNPSGNKPSDPDNNGGGKLDLGNIGKFLKEYWQAIASGISIVLIIIFLSKTASYEGRRKKAHKKADKYQSSVYAAATGLFGLASGVWTAIACVLMGLAVASFVIMLIAKSRWGKAEEELEEAKEVYEKEQKAEEERKREAENARRDENMQMMFMHMMGGGAGGGQGMPQGAYMGGGIGVDDMRMMINETVTALLPGVQQMLPQQASANDDLVTKLIEQNEKLMQQLAKKPAEKVIEKEVVASNANDELIKVMIEEQRAMREVMQRLAEQPAQQAIVQPQVIEKIVEKPVEKIVEKEVRVEVPVETVVEKVVEKPIVISTEAVGEAEKSKQVKMPKSKKAPTPRLTLEEAYAKLTKEQKKYFDGLREYAMSKDSKCKEKLSTYFTTIGPSTTNPFIKLTIKKGITVALFKMEDEYLKDIRRNASSDGTKMKIKETELPVGDKQAYDTAKDMVDLRLDQIDRYNDFLKEQRAMKRK